MEKSGMTVAERLQFAIRFAQMDLHTLRPGDWLNLRDDLLHFLFSGEVERWEHAPGLGAAWTDTGGVVPLPNALPGEPDMSQDDLRALQAETQAILTDMMQTRTMAGFFETLRAPPGIDIHVRSQVVSLLKHPKGRNVLRVQGAPRDIFLFTLQYLLILEPTDRVLGCPECGTIFYRIRKQRYCRRACSNRATVRSWRQREEVKHAEAERAHQRYAKKKQPEIGRGPKITRRPRKGSTSHAETPRES